MTMIEHASDCTMVTTTHLTCSCGAISARKQRPGDQPLPTPNDGPAIHDLVIKDVRERMALGIERYGTPLQPWNGRDVLQDLYEEQLDAAAYMRQLRIEWDRLLWLHDMVRQLYSAHITRNTVAQSQIMHSIAMEMRWRDAEQ